MQRYTPHGMYDVRQCLEGCSADMRVEVDPGVPVAAQTVGDLRSLWGWPPGLVLVVNQNSRPSI